MLAIHHFILGGDIFLELDNLFVFPSKSNLPQSGEKKSIDINSHNLYSFS